MRYLDLGVLPQKKLEAKKKKGKKVLLVFLTLVFVSAISVFAYAFYWPLKSLLAELIRNPSTALSFFKQPSGQLKSTDGKTNFLLLGIDKRANVPYTYLGPGGKQEHNGFLSDTIIVVSVDLNTKQVFMISVPRDTWVTIPSWDNFPKSQGKINSAYSLGETFSYPGGGLKLAERVASEHLGIPLHYGIRIDFEGFEKTIDTLGGIDVVVDKTFDDYSYPVEGKEKSAAGKYEHVHFDAGPTHMDGKRALRFVRSRTGTNGEGSDFARARRQQKVVQAILKKAISLNTLLDPLRLNSLFKDFGEAVETDFDLISIPQIVKLAKEVNVSKIETFVLDPSSTLMEQVDPNLYGGAYAIIPKKNDWSKVQLKIKEFLSSAPPSTTDTNR